MHHFDDGRRAGDHPQIVGAGKREPAGDLSVALHSLSEPFTVEYQGATRNGGRADHAVLGPAAPCWSRARINASRFAWISSSVIGPCSASATAMRSLRLSR